jgi:hypothetical protein
MSLPIKESEKVGEVTLSLGDTNNSWECCDHLRNRFGIAVPNRWLEPVWSEIRRPRIA